MKALDAIHSVVLIIMGIVATAYFSVLIYHQWQDRKLRKDLGI